MANSKQEKVVEGDGLQFDTRYRPSTWEEFIGNEEVVRAVRSQIGKVHRFLFSGPRGCGKTTLARLVAKELGVSDFDLHELDAATNRGINEVRALKSTIPLSALGGGKKAYIIDECHQLTGDAKDALLKTIEEPPAHVYFMLCTTDLSKMTATIRSRAKVGEFELKPLHRRDLSTLMDRVIEAEGLEISPLVMRALLAASEGIPRELLGLLEKVSTASEADALELLKHGATISEDAKSLIDCLMVGVSWPAARLVLANMKVSAEDIRRSMLGYMTKVVVGSDRPHPMALIVLDEFSKPFFSSEMENKARLALAVYQCVSRFCTKENAE